MTLLKSTDATDRDAKNSASIPKGNGIFQILKRYERPILDFHFFITVLLQASDGLLKLFTLYFDMHCLWECGKGLGNFKKQRTLANEMGFGREQVNRLTGSMNGSLIKVRKRYRRKDGKRFRTSNIIEIIKAPARYMKWLKQVGARKVFLEGTCHQKRLFLKDVLRRYERCGSETEFMNSIYNRKNMTSNGLSSSYEHGDEKMSQHENEKCHSGILPSYIPPLEEKCHKGNVPFNSWYSRNFDLLARYLRKYVSKAVESTLNIQAEKGDIRNLACFAHKRLMEVLKLDPGNGWRPRERRLS